MSIKRIYFYIRQSLQLKTPNCLFIGEQAERSFKLKFPLVMFEPFFFFFLAFLTKAFVIDFCWR